MATEKCSMNNTESIHIDKNETEDELPLVSVIIPFYNNADEVKAIIKQIFQQHYPPSKTEIICIDNGSEKSLKFSEETLQIIKLLKEMDHPNSPYSARNRGVEQSSGEIVVFIDANSRPGKGWLQSGVECLLRSGADLAAGRIDFDFEPKPTAAKVTDALTSLDMKKAVEERGAAYTANLFVKRYVFDETGLFEEGARSGGDVRWTLKAKKKGFKLAYCDGSVVYKKARSAKELYRKKIRTGRGYFYSWKMEEERVLWFYNFFRSLKPPGIRKYMAKKPFLDQGLFKGRKTGIWLHLYAVGIVEQIAFMKEFLKYNLGKQRDIDRRKRMIENEKNTD
jgi:glycosyltransferase AglE